MNEIGKGCAMMSMDGMGMGWMMLGMGLGYFLLVVLLILGIAALVKYLFFSGRRNGPGPT